MWLLPSLSSVTCVGGTRSRPPTQSSSALAGLLSGSAGPRTRQGQSQRPRGPRRTDPTSLTWLMGDVDSGIGVATAVGLRWEEDKQKGHR